MAENLVVYTVVHQPRRLKLPAQVIPKGTSPETMPGFVFDEEMNRRYFEKVATFSYTPASAMFRDLTKRGWKMSIGFSNSFLLQAEAWAPKVLDSFKRLCADPNVEVVCVEPYHSWLFYVDIVAFKEAMIRARERLEAIFQKSVTVTDTTEMFMSNDVYFALQQCGFAGAFMEGRPWQMGWREPTHVYHHPLQRLALLCRHHELSDDVGYRFSNRSWVEFPLTAERYAGWLRDTWGELVTLGWDFETFGEHHSANTGIFTFVPTLASELKKRKVRMMLPSEAIAELGDHGFEVPVNEYGTTWAGEGGMEFFLGNSAQQGIFRLMHHAYSKARLTGDPRLVEIARWLLQSDNLHLIQWFGRSGPEAEVSAYFTPDEWWELGALGILREQQRVYGNFIHALDEWAE
ncbi:MAG: glycoside hydrolase [Candidatus Dormibacteraeota bacterium]|nr:glycoside hydrolase [Candidatus Dormibacteraeota bacterium]